jgi:hypothetical protein
VRDIEGSISVYLTNEPGTTLGEDNDALRALWQLAREADPKVGMLRARIRTLPKTALQYINGRAPMVIPKLFPGDTFENGEFLVWADKANGDKLVKAVRGLVAEDAQNVAGRSRGSGKRSARRLEPMILGEVRGVGTKAQRGSAK